MKQFLGITAIISDSYLSLISIDGSVVECSPATRAARVRFPVDATFLFYLIFTKPSIKTLTHVVDVFIYTISFSLLI